MNKLIVIALLISMTSGCSLIAPMRKASEYQTYDICYTLGRYTSLELELQWEGGEEAAMEELKRRNLTRGEQMQCRSAMRDGSQDRALSGY
ncbi:hypothetical protein D0812_18925 [Vibrio owensii]|uniref:Lipoprotein n=1 Tax=Vibrio owensii TaxID=696485 RepID=A0AAP9GIJ0_9VIBR|nr:MULTISPECIES: hypothetical protein [Vibrio harveyi group]AYO16487.1 hypothetical protein D0812_18925 [Vibrio owensii]PAW11852.1 hypothetical protein B6K85_05195 [Vibrio sp. V1B]QGH50654.1 hypothetical protein APZ19_26695 [Vibrio owensii]